MTLSPPDMSERFTLRIGRGPRRGRMTAASILVHFVVLALVTGVAVKLPPAPLDRPAIPIIFSPPAMPAQIMQPLAHTALAPMPVQRVAIVRAQVAPARAAARAAAGAAAGEARPVKARQARAASAQMAAALPNAAVAPPAPQPRVAATLSAQSNDGTILLRFADDIHALVRATATMPAAAVRQHREGRAQVRFAYLDGFVQQVAVAQSSQSRLLDDAALAAVQHAHYPPPPPQLRGHLLPLLVWIDFRIQSPG